MLALLMKKAKSCAPFTGMADALGMLNEKSIKKPAAGAACFKDNINGFLFVVGL